MFGFLSKGLKLLIGLFFVIIALIVIIVGVNILINIDYAAIINEIKEILEKYGKPY